MSAQNTNTVSAIRRAGEAEFLSYGYEKASMRRIAQKAGVTTGAIYGYFPSKEALFEDLTWEAGEELLREYRKVHEDYARLSPAEQAGQLLTVTDQYIPWMIHYIYDHYTEFKLLLCCNADGAAEGYLSQMAEIEEKATWEFIGAMKSIGHAVPEMDESLIHILSRSFLQQISEFLAHDIPRERAVAHGKILGQFQHAGWRQILGL